MEIFINIALFTSVMAGGLSVFLFRTNHTRFLKLSLSFSGAFLFAICVLHLIPDVYKNQQSEAGLFILLGFFLQLLLEFFSEGIEHGHIHKHATPAVPMSIVLSLCIHSFLEGMPLANKEAGRQLFGGILLHHLPVAYALSSMLVQSAVKRSNIVVVLLIFASMAPAGNFVSQYLNNNIIANISLYFDQIMAVVIGIFLHISTTILFESSADHRFNFIKFITILLGAGLAFFSM